MLGKLQFGVYELDRDALELRKHGVPVRLQEQPLRVLAALLERPGEIVTREELQERIWGKDTFVDYEQSLNKAVNRLREALNDEPGLPRYVETVPRRGYRFIAPVTGPMPIERPPAVPSLGSDAWRRLFYWSLVAGIAGVLLLAAATYFWVSPHNAREAAKPRIRSLAVLPFHNLSGDASQDYLSEGVTEALIGRLAGIHDLRVTSHTSVMRFKNPQQSVPEIAKTLNVDAVVEGSVVREGSRIRVTAQLIRGASDEHFWSETYDREMEDALALEAELAQAIAAKIEATVTGREEQFLRTARPVVPEVYESYLKGISVLNGGGGRPEIVQSIRHFEDAIRRDQTFAPAYLGLAEAYSTLGTVFAGAPPSETRPKMINAVRKALELDPDVAEAHVLFAYTLQEEWQWTQAETEYKRALELAPNDARTQAGYAWWLGCHGRLDEGISWVRRARGLDPIAVSGNDVSWILSQAHRFDEAIRESRSAQAVRPDDASVLWFLGFALLGKGQAAEAIPFLERATTVSHGSPGTVGVLISAYARAGRRNDALRLLAELKERREKGYVPAGAFVIAYLGLDDKEAAFVWLERAYLEKSNILQWVKTNPVFDPIRGDPRFEDLIRRVGLGEGNSTEAVHQSRRGPGSRIVPRSASDATPKRW